MNLFDIGDLAHVPSDVFLVKLDSRGHVLRYHKTTKPIRALIIDTDPYPGKYSTCEWQTQILHHGENWFVNNQDISIISKKGDFDGC